MPKNIVLLSDGTGNSSAQLLKTNVWRVYESLKLTNPVEQVACYDDGVGTSSFKPLALLGGAFGVGMKRNVLRLYRFLCEHYDPGDKIFLFGFSRGAFTIRVLTALICEQGIIKTRPTLPVVGASSLPPAQSPVTTEQSLAVATAVMYTAQAGDFVFGSELTRMSRWAYRHFRRQFNQTGGLVSLFRNLRDVTFRTYEAMRGGDAYDPDRNYPLQEIEFVGVWDTVDAYGLPFDELTDGIDSWIWPLSMPEQGLSKKVQRACQALALDDERNTFHPLLWDETAERQDQAEVATERISQVWFAGMHSNVGGGYPDDALSYVSLEWMTTQAKLRGLHFIDELLKYHTDKADPFGRIYDSRSGLKGYYRYNPRRIEWLTNGQVHEQGFRGRTWPKPSPTAKIGRPKIHESVFTRMAAAPEGYAPIVFPKRYAVVMNDGSILDGHSNPFEKPEASERRFQAQEVAWDLVWYKRLVYFITVAVSLVLAWLPWRDGAQASLDTAEHGLGERAVRALAQFLPDFASPWVNYYQANPWELAIGASTVLLLMRVSTGLQGSICQAMRGIWLLVIPPATGQLTLLKPSESALWRLRRHPWYQGAFSVLRRKILPTAFGVASLVWLVALANRAPFEVASGLGWWCQGDAQSGVPLVKGVPSKPIPFTSAGFCQPSGVRLETGAQYRLQLQLPEKREWRDAAIEVDSPAGFTSVAPQLSVPQRVLFSVLFFFPFRRLWTADWFVPVARIDERGVDQYHLSTTSTDITARTSGELFMFVNDAIVPLNLWPPSLGWTSYYVNNRGTATVIVTKLEDSPTR